MTKIKFCGLRRPSDLEAVNQIKPDFVGFVFWDKSKRYVSFAEAAELKKLLDPGIAAVGVFVDAAPEEAAGLANSGIIDMIQLHGHEDEAYIRRLRSLTDKPLIKAFIPSEDEDSVRIEKCTADYVLIDSGAGSGKRLAWEGLSFVKRPYFLAGGLAPENAAAAVQRLRPYAVDVSSGIETGGYKDFNKMAAFAAAVRRTQ